MIKHHEQAREGRMFFCVCLGFQRKKCPWWQLEPQAQSCILSTSMKQREWTGVGQGLKHSKPAHSDIFLHQGYISSASQTTPQIRNISHLVHHRKLAGNVCHVPCVIEFGGCSVFSYHPCFPDFWVTYVPISDSPVNTLVHQTTWMG